MKKISVIVPVYNVEKELCRCVDSIISQTYRNVEIILVDDGSSDNSPSIIDDYGKKYSNVNVIHQKNKGLSGARNAGLDMCTGEYVAFVDSDDYIDNRMFEEMINKMETADADIAICGRYDEFPNLCKSIQSFTKAKTTIYTKDETMRSILLWNDVDIAAWDKVYKRCLWNDIRFPLGRNNEDICTIPKIIANTKKSIHVGQAFYHYCHRAGSITTTYNEKKIKDFYIAINEITNTVHHSFSGLEDELVFYKNHSFLSLWKMGEEIHYFGSEIESAKQYLSENWDNPFSYNRFSLRERINYIMLKFRVYRSANELYYFLKHN